jgi:gluconolactonase
MSSAGVLETPAPLARAATRGNALRCSATLAFLAFGPAALAQVTGSVPTRRPPVVVDLATREGLAAVAGRWAFREAEVVPVEFRRAGVDMKASGAAAATHDVAPRAGAAGFDDSAWETVDPTTLTARRGTGRLSFAWYRLRFTVPERLGTMATDGATIVFETVVDDYAEVWVDGQLPLVLGQTGGPAARGWNAANRLVVGRNVHPGQRVDLAVFAANGPLSQPAENFIWIRSATLEVFPPGVVGAGEPVPLVVDRQDPALDRLVPPGSKLERLATGFSFGEGPVWAADGFLLFSDPNDNVVYRRSADGEVALYRPKSGYAGLDIGRYHQPGSNGLALDREGRLTLCEHGNRRVTRIEKNGVVTVLAERYQGKRLNSPNDLIYRSDGSLYFTDPPFGLPAVYDDPAKELSYSGVFRWSERGGVQLVASDLAGPNGLAFSPDETFLYVSNWDDQAKVVKRYPVAADGSLGTGEVFFDMTQAPGAEALDGVKVDREGNVYVSGPGGVWIISPAGKHLGTLAGPELPANFAWGDADRATLYMTARTGLYRLRVGVPGASTAW